MKPPSGGVAGLYIRPLAWGEIIGAPTQRGVGSYAFFEVIPMFRRLSFAMILSLALLASAMGAEQPSVSAWLVDPLIKIFPSDLPGSHVMAPPELWAARNQHVAIQLAIRSALPLQGLTAEAEPLKGPGKAAIASVAVRPVGYVVVGSHSKNTPAKEMVGEAPGWYPDPILNFPIDLQRRRTQPLWVSIAIPLDAAPGLYRGTVVVRSGKRSLARASYSVRVVAAAVPSERSLKVTNWFNFNRKASRQFYGLKEYSPEWWTLIENVAHVMAEHRLNVVMTDVLDLDEPRVESGQLRYDFANLDRWVETFRKAGVIGYIEGSHLLDRAGSYEAALLVGTYQIEDGELASRRLPPDDPRVEPFLKGFLSALNAHLEEKGWKGIYLQHILDEAHGKEPPYYARFAELVRRYLPGVPTMDAVDADEMPEELKKNCDIWVPLLGRFDKQMDMIQKRIQDGHEVWFYTCLFPNQQYMNRLMDYPLLKVRLLHWLDFRYNFTGYLHWGWNYWSPEPYNDTQPVIDDNTELLPSGDAFIVYPDRAGKSVFSSIRFETMLQGIEDYELLRALKAKQPAKADRLAQKAITSLTDYVREPGAFRRLERQLLEASAK